MYDDHRSFHKNFEVTFVCGHVIHLYPAPFKDDVLYCVGCENGQVVSNIKRSAIGAARKVY